MACHTQHPQIQINNLDTDHGYLIFSDKPLELPTEFEHHCLRINITEIDKANNLFRKHLSNYTKSPHLKYLYGKLQRQLNGLTLHGESRQKRGLINAVGSMFKFLFGTLDDDDRVKFQGQLENMGKNSIQLHEMNNVINQINENMEKMERNRNMYDSFTYELMQFIEYVEDVEMGMQLSRLGLFNPKWLNYDKLDNVNNRNILLVKTSTWINHQDNIILIISHIPINFKTFNTLKIIPYPDHNGYQLDYTSTTSYFELDNKIYTRENIQIDDECISKILLHTTPICNFEHVVNTESIMYVEPNVIVTWNLSTTFVKQNCQSNTDLSIQGNKIIRISDCELQINEIILYENKLSPEIDLTQMYSPLKITKVKTIKHDDVLTIVSKNNTLIYIIFVSIIIVFLIILLYLKYVTTNPIVMIYSKIKKQQKEQVPEIELQPQSLPTLYPSVTS